jgi:hypothetical protein
MLFLCGGVQDLEEPVACTGLGSKQELRSVLEAAAREQASLLELSSGQPRQGMILGREQVCGCRRGWLSSLKITTLIHV